MVGGIPFEIGKYYQTTAAAAKPRLPVNTQAAWFHSTLAFQKLATTGPSTMLMKLNDAFSIGHANGVTHRLLQKLPSFKHKLHLDYVSCEATHASPSDKLFAN